MPGSWAWFAFPVYRGRGLRVGMPLRLFARAGAVLPRAGLELARAFRVASRQDPGTASPGVPRRYLVTRAR
jgi:hypothetical protein